MTSKIMHRVNALEAWVNKGDGVISDKELQNFLDDLKSLIVEYKLCARSDQDLKNVLKAALYMEKDGIDLVHRLTTHALNARTS